MLRVTSATRPPWVDDYRAVRRSPPPSRQVERALARVPGKNGRTYRTATQLAHRGVVRPLPLAKDESAPTRRVPWPPPEELRRGGRQPAVCRSGITRFLPPREKPTSIPHPRPPRRSGRTPVSVRASSVDPCSLGLRRPTAIQRVSATMSPSKRCGPASGMCLEADRLQGP